MIDIVLFCVVVIVPLLLALLVMDVVAGTRPRFQTDDHMLASAGIFRGQPARKRHHGSARDVLPDAELGGVPAFARKSLSQPAGIGSATLPVAADGADRLPASV